MLPPLIERPVRSRSQRWKYIGVIQVHTNYRILHQLLSKFYYLTFNFLQDLLGSFSYINTRANIFYFNTQKQILNYKQKIVAVIY